nr:hypothetical protein [Tanacetum cinerariifolium]
MFRIQEYLQHEHYALWEVIEFGDSYKALSEETAKDKGLPGELRFSKYDSAKELREAILKTFGGNEATKKTKKNHLKQQYGKFKAEGSETLKQTFNRLQAILSHLEFMDVPIEQDDLNQKFLTTLAPEWLVGKSEVPTVQGASIASAQVPTVRTDVAASNRIHDTICAFIATQQNGSQIKDEDTSQIDDDEIEEMDIKWNLTSLSMRADRTPRSQDKGKGENYKKDLKVEETAPKAMIALVVLDGIEVI